MPELIDSCGMELEVEDIVPRLPDSLQRYYQGTHDASCETSGARLGCGLLIKGRPKNIPFPYQNTVVGGEIVSGILDTSDPSYIGILKMLTDFLISSGESEESYRAGVHFHICFSSPNLRMLKATIRLWVHLEDIFYHLGGMGYKFRGVENDSIYCRPLTGTGPIVVPTPHGWAQVFNTKDLLDSKTLTEFWERLGDTQNTRRRGERYFPCRYHGFNLCPNLDRGTIEFRVFNKTLNPYFLYSCMELCKAFARFCLGNSYENFKTHGLLEVNSIFDNRNLSAMEATLERFARIVELDREVLRNLNIILERTPHIELPQNLYTSHLRNVRMHWEEGTSYVPQTVRKGDIKSPHFVDRHILDGER